MIPFRPVASAAGHVCLALAAALSSAQSAVAQGGSVWIEARGVATIPVGEELADFADPAIGVGAAIVFHTSTRVFLSGSIDITSHGPPGGVGDDWDILAAQGQVGLSLLPDGGVRLAPMVGVGFVRFDPDPGTDLLTTITPLALSAGARLTVPLGARSSVVARGSLVMATGGESPGPDGSFFVPLGLGLALRL